MSSPTPRKKTRRYAPIGDYEILAHIATGGMGAVYQAKHSKTGQIVALKVLSPALASNTVLLERFRREANRGVKLRHENLVTMLEFSACNGIHFLALEFVDGPDLHDYIDSKERLTPDETIPLLIQAARVLHYLHNHHVVHRDIKPSNFLLARGDNQFIMKLTDLGLSRELSDDEYRVTRADHTVGTIDYMAPEQARNSRLADIRSDIYSLGCTAYHMLTGKPPFPDGGVMERLCKHAEAAPVDVRQHNPQVSIALTAVIHKMLAKKPCDRQQSPAQLLDELQQALAPGETPSSTARKAFKASDESAPVKAASSSWRPPTPPSDPGLADSNSSVLLPIVPLEQQQAAVGQFERAKQVLGSGNVDYGIHLLRSCCQIDPVNLSYRKLLRRIEKTKYRNNRRGSWFAWLTTVSAKARIKTARQTGEHWKVLSHGEDVLVRNPWDLETQLCMARAAEKLGLFELAIWILLEVWELDHHVIGVNRSLARLYEVQGDLPKAIEHWKRIAHDDPSDVTAPRQVQNLSARETIRRGHYDQTSADPNDPAGRITLRRA